MENVSMTQPVDPQPWWHDWPMWVLCIALLRAVWGGITRYFDTPTRAELKKIVEDMHGETTERLDAQDKQLRVIRRAVYRLEGRFQAQTRRDREDGE